MSSEFNLVKATTKRYYAVASEDLVPTNVLATEHIRPKYAEVTTGTDGIVEVEFSGDTVWLPGRRLAPNAPDYQTVWFGALWMMQNRRETWPAPLRDLVTMIESLED